MKLAGAFLKSVILYGCVFLLIVLVIFLPRDLQAVPSHQSKYVMVFQYHLDWKLYLKQVGSYLRALISGNMGFTRDNISVKSTLSEFMPRSLLIIIPSFLMSFPLGLLKGIYDFRSAKRGRGFLGFGSTFIMLALPDFFVIIMLQWLIITLVPFLDPFAFGYQNWYSFILPTVLVSMYPIFYYARITASALSEQERRPYVQVAQSKGFTERFVLYKHMLANCWPMLIRHLPTGMIAILSNLLIVEYLMDYKGGAYRLFKAFSYTGAFHMGENKSFEADVIAGFSLVFIGIMLLVHLLTQFISHVIEPK